MKPDRVIIIKHCLFWHNAAVWNSFYVVYSDDVCAVLGFSMFFVQYVISHL